MFMYLFPRGAQLPPLGNNNLFFNRFNDLLHLHADLWVERFGAVLGQDLTGFSGCPVAGIVLLGFPFAIRPPVHQRWHEELTHVSAGMLLSEIVPTRTHIR